MEMALRSTIRVTGLRLEGTMTVRLIDSRLYSTSITMAKTNGNSKYHRCSQYNRRQPSRHCNLSSLSESRFQRPE